MPLIPLKFRPGINKELTDYSNEGGWFDMDKVRFRFGYPEKISGWIKRSTTQQFAGRCRALISWVDLRRERYIGIGTNLKYYIDRGTTLFDITPIRQVMTSTAVGNVTIDYSGSNAQIPAAQALLGQVFVSIGPISVTGVSATASVGDPIKNTDGTTQLPDDSAVVRNLSGVSATGIVNNTVGIADDIFITNVTGVSATSSIGSSYITIIDSEDGLSFSVTSGSNLVTVTTDTAHGAETGDFVTFSGVVSTPGGLDVNLAQALNQEYAVTRLTPLTFTVKAREFNKSIMDITVNGIVDESLFPQNATQTTSNGGGIDATASFQETTGRNVSQLFNGWNAGAWGSQGWGQTVAADSLRLWHHSTFGEDLIINYRDGPVFYWDATNDVTSRAVNLTDLPGANRVPQIAKQVLVSDRDRHVIAFGCDPELTPGVQDPLIIRFSDSETITDWQTRAENTAGELRLGLGSQIVQAVETKQQILVFTDTTLYTMQFLGPPYTFGVSAVSEKITIQSPNSAIAVDDVVYWMGANEFYVYQGSVQRVPCTVRDYVFNDFNFDQAEKVISGVNSEHSEIWWFYPSANFDDQDSYQNEDINRYVIYNYQEQTWSIGTLNRTAWMDRGLYTFPIAAGTDGHLYEHERGFDDGSTSPARPIAAFIESSPFDVGEGDRFMFIKKLIPDVSFKDSSAASPFVTLGLETDQYPGSTTPLNPYNPFPFLVEDGYVPEDSASATYDYYCALAILRASVGLAPYEELFVTAEATPGRSLGDISNEGDVTYIDSNLLLLYIQWKYGPLTTGLGTTIEQSEIDYIEDTMIPYMAARPELYKPYYDDTNNTSDITKRSNANYQYDGFTEYVNTRLRGRSAYFKISSNSLGVGWRLGTPKLEVRQSGRR